MVGLSGKSIQVPSQLVINAINCSCKCTGQFRIAEDALSRQHMHNETSDTQSNDEIADDEPGRKDGDRRNGESEDEEIDDEIISPTAYVACLLENLRHITDGTVEPAEELQGRRQAASCNHNTIVGYNIFAASKLSILSLYGKSIVVQHPHLRLKPPITILISIQWRN